jgi:diguanylate cyclase (GGDEF)-like protein/PAS domain S-box-containing protein
VGSVSSSGDEAPTFANTDLLVSGDEALSRVIENLLDALRPAVHIHYASPEQLLADDGALAGEHPEAIFGALAQLDPSTIDWLRRVIAKARLPLIVVLEADPAERSALRERARAAGAIDCLLRDELSSALLESAVAHARSVNRQSVRLHDVRQRYALAIRGARDGMWEWDLLHDRVYYSQRWCELLGVRSSDVTANLDGWLLRVHPQDLERLRSELEAVIEGPATLHESEHRIRDGGDEWRWVMTRAVVHRSPSGQAVRMAGSLTDISPFRLRERALREQSRHDSLTKLPDRRVFLERCARAVELSRAHDDYVFVVLLVVVDRLGQTRDSFGIDAADQLFALLAKRVRGCLRPEDHLFRFSSSKLAILLEDVEDPSFGTQVANRIHEAVAEPFEFDGISTFTTVSIGMTSSAHGYTRVEEVVADVSAATDSARDHGSNRHEIYDTSMRIESRTLLALEMAMRRAIDDSQFELHFQPIVRVDRLEVLRGFTPDALLGFEALLRWQHPERGLVSPAEFIPIAEDTGLIVPIGRWVIREAVRSLHAWHEEFGNRELAVSVNLSAKQVGDPLLLETIDAVLGETGLPPTCLKIELTESVMLDRIDEVTALLQSIRARGIQIWIDDFGTGYSSLGYLHRFPVDGLKIDRAFISRLDGTQASQTMVRTILDLAANFGLDVVAEGIETEVQAKHLRELGCLWCQGWLFGKAQPPAQVRALLG